ncbi:MAG TPA: SpoIIE family protein phosphatase [Terracidiphilus sp.]|nr:SpoIIE family protein phosphatase [Terracidiphilus sp.]
MRNWLAAFFLALPCALCAQVSQVPASQCVYRLGDNSAWSAANIDLTGWKPYSAYRMTGDAIVVWVRCHATFDTSGIQHPALVVSASEPGLLQVYVDGRAVRNEQSRILDTFKDPVGGAIFPPSSGSAHTERIIAARLVQHMLIPGNTPGPPTYIYFGDGLYIKELAGANSGNEIRGFLPAYSSYLVIGAAGLFLLGLFFFDRSLKAAFWLGIFCCCVSLTRINVLLPFLLNRRYSLLLDGMFFGLGMFESWALVRVNFALARRRAPAIYWVVFAAWVFILVGSILPAVLPDRLALPLSLFVQVTMFKPIWCIWGFACTAPFVAFWPWTRLHGRLRIVAALCGVWAILEGWFQLQQVFLGRNTWSGLAQDWMSLAIAALVVALLGYIFREQSVAADERAELRGELAAARQVQRLLVPDQIAIAPGVAVSSAFLPAHEVGGDFYLCRALANGAQRIILGDVSGKGVAAALTSALLLGAANRCDQLRPAAVLNELNEVLRNSGISGFTTCLCADLLPGGALLIANAGQLPPYCNGHELEIPTSLPLGIAPAGDYIETRIELAPGDTLTFLSDGVVEARNASGELFGFERTRAISDRTAQQIADAAVGFGQQDDITVLTLSFVGIPATA